MIRTRLLRSVPATIILAGSLFGLVACAAPSRAPAPAPESGSASPPPVAVRVATEYRKLDASAPQPPIWTLTEPDDDKGMHFLVALSEFHASEQAAREEAMANARKAYAQYTGVAVSEVDEVIRSMYGQASDVFDPTVAGRSKSTQSTDAQVSRIKAKHWYWEKYQARKGGTEQGQAFKYWVLVTVPTDEFQRVQTWKTEQAAAKAQHQQMVEQQAERDLQTVLKAHAESAKVFNHELEEGEIAEALSLILPEWTKLGDAVQHFQGKGGAYAKRAYALEAAQQETLQWAAKVRNSLVIDTGRCGNLCTLSASGEQAFSVWVFGKGAHMHPVTNLLLTLGDAQGTVVARATTDAYGKSVFQVANLTPGRYRVGIDPKGGALATLDPALVEDFSKIETFLQINSAPGNFEGTIHNALFLLFAGPTHQPPIASRVTLGPVTYGNSHQGTELSIAVQRQMRQALTRIPGLSVIEPRPRDVQVVAQAVTRGISMVQASPGGETPTLGSAATQALIDGAKAALESSYTISAGTLLLDLTLREAGTDKLVAATAVSIPLSALPPGLQLIPVSERPQLPPPPPQPAGEAIRLQVASHLGDGQTYQDGESISWFVNTNRDAYLLLIYEDVSHNLIQILPNRYSGNSLFPAGNYLQIPGPKDRFEFTITGPYGLERVRAFAASRPFPQLPSAELENGLYLVQSSLATVLDTLRRHGQAPGVAYGEAEATITTVAKR